MNCCLLMVMINKLHQPRFGNDQPIRNHCMKINLPYSTKLLAPALAGLLVAGVSPFASAQLYVYEPFDYAPGSDILGQNGGVGFTSAWTIQSGAGAPSAQAFTAVAGSLAAPVGLTTSGGHAILTGEFGTLQAARSFNNIVGADGTTTWFSFIAQRQGATGGDFPNNPYPRGVNVGLFDTEATATQGGTLRPERVGVGNSSNAPDDEWSIIPEGSGALRVGSGESFADLYWAVLRIDHHGDHTVADDVYLFLNPDPLVEPDPSSAVAAILGLRDYSNLDFVRPFVGNPSGNSPFGVLIMDELRIGGDYASMSATVVPEPTAMALLGFGGLALMFRRRS